MYWAKIICFKGDVKLSEGESDRSVSVAKGNGALAPPVCET